MLKLPINYKPQETMKKLNSTPLPPSLNKEVGIKKAQGIELDLFVESDQIEIAHEVIERLLHPIEMIEGYDNNGLYWIGITIKDFNQ